MSVWVLTSPLKLGALEKLMQTVPGCISEALTFSNSLLGTPVTTMSDCRNASVRVISISDGCAFSNLSGPFSSKL